MLQCVVCENWLHSKCILPESQKPEDQDQEELPLALDLDDFENLICADCATKSSTAPIWNKHAGTNGFILVDDQGNNYGKLPADQLKSTKNNASEHAEDEGPPAKKVKAADGSATPVQGEAIDSNACKAPGSAAIFAQLAENKHRFAASLFLQDGWRDRLCRCSEVSPFGALQTIP